jgi:hypothetical protein
MDGECELMNEMDQRWLYGIGVTDPTKGQVWRDETTNVIYQFDGSEWITSSEVEKDTSEDAYNRAMEILL